MALPSCCIPFISPSEAENIICIYNIYIYSASATIERNTFFFLPQKSPVIRKINKDNSGKSLKPGV